MKCSVCGNELKENSTKCSVCGTAYNKNQGLSAAMSNISSLANALRAKREINNNKKSFEEDLKRVATQAQDLEELYTKDINLKVNEDVDDNFDLNAFYEEASLAKEEQNIEAEKANNIVFDEDEELEEEESLEPEDESNDDNDTQDEENLDEEQEVDVDVEDFSLEEEMEDSEDLEEEESFDEEEKFEEEEETFEEESETTYETSEEESEEISNEPEDEDNSEEVEISVDVDGFEEVKDEETIEPSNSNLGYIKESDIQTGTQEEVGNGEDNSKEVDISDASSDNQQGKALAQIEPVGVPANEVNGEASTNEEFASVKPEDVPYTELEEQSGGASSDDKPIVLSDSEVVGTSNAIDGVAQADTKSNDKPQKAKYNKFCGVIAKILITLSILVFSVYLAHHFFLKDIEKSNVVFDFINNFLGNKMYLHYTLLGVMGALALAILFSFFQLIFVKRRKMGAVLLIISIIISGAVVGGLYYLEQLMPVIRTLLGFFN